MLNANDILGANDLLTEEVNVPEWGGTVRVSSITAKTRDEHEFYYQKNREKLSFRALWVAATAVDENGKHIFTTDQVEALGKKNAAAINRVFDVAARLNGLMEADVEEIEKNSERGPGDDSPSS